ncbi:helix-turn-helix domain-containing protein [Williamsia sp.]|uniref:helix-turn-helix transcriptional regulator n=1 Tax=Williamsia sp. TaxID=1872085 RepID=UPI002F9574A8
MGKISLKQAAELTGFSVDYLRRLAKSGELPASRRGKRLIVVDPADLALLDRPL